LKAEKGSYEKISGELKVRTVFSPTCRVWSC
jgi:hypothetical protein